MRGMQISWDGGAISFVGPEPGDFGVYAAADVPEGAVLCTIPKSALLSVKNSEAAGLLEAEAMRGGLGLIVAVMYERAMGAKSKWHGYLSSLPPREYVPLFWSDEELALLEGTELEGRALEDREVTEEDFDDNVAHLAQKYGLPKSSWRLHDFHVAASWVASRAFYVDSYHGTAMVPLADLFNHKPSVVALTEEFEVAEVADGSDGDDVDDDEEEEGGEEEEEEEEEAEEEEPAAEPSAPKTGTAPVLAAPIIRDGMNLRLEIAICDCERGGVEVLEIVAASSVAKGCEVHNTYGEHGNAELLHKYGFAMDRNPFNEVTLDLQSVVDCAEAALEEAARRQQAQKAGPHVRPAQESSADDLAPLDAATEGRVQRELRRRMRLLSKESSIVDPESPEPLLVMPSGCVSKPLLLLVHALTCDVAVLDAAYAGGGSIEGLLELAMAGTESAPDGAAQVDEPGAAGSSNGGIANDSGPFSHAVPLASLPRSTLTPQFVGTLAAALRARAARLPGNERSTAAELAALVSQAGARAQPPAGASPPAGRGGGGRSRGKGGSGGDGRSDGRAEWAVAARGALTLRLSEQAVLRQALQALGAPGPGGGGGGGEAEAGRKRRRG
ncbi:hypothetical protein FOA52_002788 [Chlamydomonas sp. UWO 241]|nr:hypothetical protein FOA52_002788 [Chlamydomonas sp. UWO 241]